MLQLHNNKDINEIRKVGKTGNAKMGTEMKTVSVIGIYIKLKQTYTYVYIKKVNDKQA